MSYEYDRYLEEHRANVARGFYWFTDNLPELLEFGSPLDWDMLRTDICQSHDKSKNMDDEYYAYDAYFYGGNRSYEVKENFEMAFLRHLHRNGHHWQHWILPAYDDEKGQRVFEMPYNYILEMICDWWSFSWKSGNLMEIFSWYDDHKDHIQLGEKTRKSVEDILEKMKDKLSKVQEQQ